MDPLKPSPSEEAMLQKLQSTSLRFPKVDQTPTIPERNSRKGWKKVKEKRASPKIGPISEYLFMKSFIRLFSTFKSIPNNVSLSPEIQS